MIRWPVLNFPLLFVPTDDVNALMSDAIYSFYSVDSLLDLVFGLDFVNLLVSNNNNKVRHLTYNSSVNIFHFFLVAQGMLYSFRIVGGQVIRSLP